ncbi:hypothetical protein [Rufibacter immobilis]|uniref:hypothetical protein n=1 Tax=Rufibacter immobilis TaxID=1348778 RepID=UPI0035EDA3CF
MKNIALKFLIIIFLVFGTQFSFSQIIMQDTRGKDVFEFYKGGDFQATFVPSQISAQANYNFVLGSPFFYYIDSVSNKTVGVSYSLPVILKITGSGINQGKPYDIESGLVRPAYRLEVGWQRNLNTFYNIRAIPEGNNFTHAMGINLYGEIQNVNFYDTIAQKQTNERPFVYGFRAHANFFETWYGVLALSFSIDLYRSYNQENLKLYQQRTIGTYIDPNIIATNPVMGNIGVFEKATAYRLRGSLPIFINQYVSFIPYTSFYGYLDDDIKNTSGFTLNILNGAPRMKNSSIAQGFGFSIDWENNNSKWSSPNYSLHGSFDIALLRKQLLGIEGTNEKF